jgi:hypothetical protein
MIKKPLQIWKANTGLKVMLISHAKNHRASYEYIDNEYWSVIILEQEKEEYGINGIHYSSKMESIQNTNAWPFPKLNFFYNDDRLYRWELSEL